MSEDITYQEIEFIKNEINNLVLNIESYAKEESCKLDIHDINFFRYISKQIIFLKYIAIQKTNAYLIKVLISDYFHLMIAIIRRQERYAYLNERSIIEGYLRMIFMSEDYITRSSFEALERIESVSQSAYSTIREEYRISCGYIHGNTIMRHTLVDVFNEFLLKDKEPIEFKQYYKKVISLIKALNIILVLENKEFINGTFHRKKSIMSYLIGKNCVELLFQ